MQPDNSRQSQPRHSSGSAGTGKKMDNVNGHEIILKSYISNKSPIRLTFNNGDHQDGRVTQFDKFTITLMKRIGDLEAGLETYFKHSIKSFSPVAK